MTWVLWVDLSNPHLFYGCTTTWNTDTNRPFFFSPSLPPSLPPFSECQTPRAPPPVEQWGLWHLTAALWELSIRCQCVCVCMCDTTLLTVGQMDRANITLDLSRTSKRWWNLQYFRGNKAACLAAHKCTVEEERQVYLLKDECYTRALAFAIVKCEWLQVVIFSVYIYAVLKLQIQSSLNKYLGAGTWGCL